MYKDTTTIEGRLGPIPPADPALEKLLKELPRSQPKAPGFWDKHEASYRAGRLVQATAIILSTGRAQTVVGAVDMAFAIEARVQYKFEQEKQ